MADTSNPDNPVETGSFDLSPLNATFSLSLNGNLLAATGRPGFLLLDVTNPANPVIVSQVLYDDPNTWVTASAFDGERLFVGRTVPSFDEYAVVDAYDVSDPMDPVKVGFFDELPMEVTGMDARDGNVYVADWFGGAYALQFAPTTAKLNLAMIARPDPVTFNGHLTFRIRVYNEGPADAKNVVLTDVVSANGTVIGVDPLPLVKLTGTSVDTATTVTVNFDTIEAGHMNGADITVRPNDLGEITNTASVTADNAMQPPPVADMTVTVEKGPGPDLTGVLANVKEITPPGSSNFLRRRLTGSYLYMNRGDAAAKKARVRFFLSTDKWFDPSIDLPLSSLTRNFINVRPRQGYSMPISYFEPKDTRFRGRYLIALIEVLSTPGDSYSKNDVAVFGPIGGQLPIAP